MAKRTWNLGMLAWGLAGVLIATAPARATIVLSQQAVQSATNIQYALDPNDATQHTAIGTDLNNNQIPGGTPVLSIQTDVQMKVGGGGQSDVEVKNANEAFGKITITPSSFFGGFLVIGLNPQGAGVVNDPITMTATAFYLDGGPLQSYSQNFSFSNNGQNFIKAEATGSETITKLELTISPAGTQSLKQIRVDVVPAATATPEPSAIALAASCLPIGLIIWMRHRGRPGSAGPGRG